MFSSNLIIGHKNTLDTLVNLYYENNLPKKILITGQKGIGKSLFVENFLNIIYSKSKNNINIEKLISTNSHPNIFKIFKKKDSKNIDVQQIREMIKYQNLSSFNNNDRFIFIEDIENLNINSSNALLKSLEEPNKNLYFLLTNNLGSKVLDTIKSRCLEFRLNLKLNEVEEIVNKYFNQNIYSNICVDYINIYNSPSFLISLINFFNDINKDISNFSIESLLNEIIHKKHYLSNDFIKNNLNLFIELFFYKNINISKKISFKIKKYFYLKLSFVKKYNLDFESFFLEFNDKLLSE